jgi:hypothetical protein
VHLPMADDWRLAVAPEAARPCRFVLSQFRGDLHLCGSRVCTPARVHTWGNCLKGHSAGSWCDATAAQCAAI